MLSPTRDFDSCTIGHLLGALVRMRPVDGLSSPGDIPVAVPVLLNLDRKGLIHVDPLTVKDLRLACLIQVIYENKQILRVVSLVVMQGYPDHDVSSSAR
jgi:hypothetical protein